MAPMVEADALASLTGVCKLAERWGIEALGDGVISFVDAAQMLRHALMQPATAPATGKVAPMLVAVNDAGEPLAPIYPATRQWFECAECGPHVAADEECCCVTCGRDISMVYAWDPAPVGGPDDETSDVEPGEG